MIFLKDRRCALGAGAWYLVLCTESFVQSTKPKCLFAMEKPLRDNAPSFLNLIS